MRGYKPSFFNMRIQLMVKSTIQKLIDKGALKGNEKGELMLIDVMLRIFVANDRMGLYGE